MRFPILLLLTVSLVGCAEMHGRYGDGGTADASTCSSRAPFFCATACNSDALDMPTCVADAWTCPPGTIDLSSCPCGGGAPGPGCVCRGSSWDCGGGICPDGINPWDPSDPLSACRFDGATCSGGGDSVCGAGLFCTCESGRWNCAVAEPDPVCWCGREPSVGDPCNEEDALCGQCCPTADGPNWPAMQCDGGRWQAAACLEVVCPPVEFLCPSDTASAIGTACTMDAQLCGNPCCGTAITCEFGRWRHGPEAACACELGVECGSGSCTRQQYCRSRCGPDDGIETHCIALPDACRSCDCLELPDGHTCAMVDGHPHVSEPLFCG